MTARVDAAERLLALVIALTHTRHRMTKAQIRSSVTGYASAPSTESFDRMFERDKDTLRNLGVPLVTLTDSLHEDDVGYRIDTSTYELPAVDFTPAEVGVLSLAAQVWQDSALSGQARRGLTKLRAITGAAEPVGAGFTHRLRGPEAAFEVLLEAILERQPVRFRYRAASTGASAVREVHPWRLYAKDRGWYLVGFDTARQGQRSFRLSRIEGKVLATGQPGQVQVPREPEAPAPPLPTQAQLAVAPGRAAAVRSRAIAGEPGDGRGYPDREVLMLRTGDVEQLAEELATYGAAVLVLDPPELREAVLQRLRAAAALSPGEGHDG